MSSKADMNERIAAVKKRDTGLVNGDLYESFPDGSELDYNRIFDAVDKALKSGKKKTDPLKDVKRYLYQYRDARRNMEIIQDRYDLLTAPLYYDEQRFLRNPACRLDIAAQNVRELPAVRKLLSRAEKECNDAKIRVALAVSSLGKDTHKLIVTAHFVCGAGLKWISTVYGHTSYWAGEVCDKALSGITPYRGGKAAGRKHAGAVAELDWLIMKWEKDEIEFGKRLAEELPPEPLDDRKMMLGML